ncbi:MAG: hypothetical protein ACFFDT_26245, partial [Candidatus Hodarchaeota archaeon]
GNYTSTIYLCTGDCPSENMISQNYDSKAIEPDNVIVHEIQLEPVTIEPGQGTVFPLYNPSGLVVGGTANYKISVMPSLPPGEISWSQDTSWTPPGGNPTGTVSFPNGNTGELVSVVGGSPGDVRLQASILNFNGPPPTIDLKVLSAEKRVNVYVYVVNDDEGNGSSWTQNEISTLINNANDIYQQAGMIFDWDGVIHPVNNIEWMTIDKVGDEFPELGPLFSSEKGTGGLELYFVEKIIGATGVNWSPGDMRDGLAMSRDGNFRTLAHEIGHACDLDDIYVEKEDASGSVIRLGNDLVKQAWMPDDWNSGPGPQYYNKLLNHQDLIKRLLMYGKKSDSKCDIPKGDIFGINADALIVPNGVSVSLDMINRDDPQHE